MAMQKSSIYEITDLALTIAKKYIFKDPETVIDVEEKKEEWTVIVEVVERKSIPDTQDLLGRYRIRIDKNGELIGWTQTMIRRRCDLVMPTDAAEEE